MIQAVANGIIAGSSIALIAMGFATRYRVEKFIDMSLPVIFTSGAYGALVGIRQLSLPFPLSMAFGILISCVIGGLFEVILWSRLRGKASSFVHLLASLGLYSIGLSIISMIFSADIQSLAPSGARPTYAFIGARITDFQAIIIFSGAGTAIVVAALHNCTLFGKKLRAVSCNKDLAAICGTVNFSTHIRISIMTSALMGFAGVLCAIDLNMEPTMGLRPYLWGIVAAIGGGLRSVTRIVLASVALGILINTCGWYLGAKWQDSIALLVMVGIFLFSPQNEMRHNQQQN